MNFDLTEEQEQIRAAIERLCEPFDADYWLRKDREGGFPDDFHQALAQAGWLGIAMPQEYGGAGLGITEAALMMQRKVALGRGAQYAKERVVFDRPIGQNQGIQHPLARSWMELEAANLMVLKAAALHDAGRACAAEANAAKYLAAEACFRACENAILTHEGIGYAKEYHVERYMREAWIPRLAPVSAQLILCFIAEKALGLPKSY